MPLSAIWEKHRRFLLTVAGGLVVYCFLSYLIQGYRGEALARERRNETKAANIERIMGQLDLTYDRTMKESQVQDKRLQNLRQKTTLAAYARCQPPPGEEKNHVTDFYRQQERVWQSFGERANRISLEFPIQKEVDFELSSELGEQDWTDRYRQLDVVQRVLDAAADLRFRRIEAIIPRAVESEAIPGAKQQALIRYPVQVKFEASVETVLALFSRFQKDSEFIGVETDELTRDPDDPAGVVRASIFFVGLDVGAPREEAKKRGPRRGGFRGGRKR